MSMMKKTSSELRKLSDDTLAELSLKPPNFPRAKSLSAKGVKRVE